MDEFKRRRLRRFKEYLTSSKTLILGTFFTGAFFLFSGFFVINRLFRGSPPKRVEYSCVAFSLLWIIISFIFVIIKRELPRTGGLSSFEGWFAVLVGVIGLAMSVAAEIYFLRVIFGI